MESFFIGFGIFISFIGRVTCAYTVFPGEPGASGLWEESGCWLVKGKEPLLLFQTHMPTHTEMNKTPMTIEIIAVSRTVFQGGLIKTPEKKN